LKEEKGDNTARPHGKILMGKEGGGKSQHWYDFVETRKRIKRSLRWDGGCPASKPGCGWFIAKPLVVENKKEEV
jgi:hypothetical protein